MVLGSAPAKTVFGNWHFREMPMFGAGADPKTIEKLRKNVKTNYFLILAIRKVIMNKHVQGRWFPVFLARCKLAHKYTNRFRIRTNLPYLVHFSIDLNDFGV